MNTIPAPRARDSGRSAEQPTQIPPRGWWQITRRGFRESRTDNVTMLAGGVAFFGFLARFPALIALIVLYGLVADPADVTRQLASMAGTLPSSAQALITEQLTSVTQTSGGALTFGPAAALFGERDAGSRDGHRYAGERRAARGRRP